MAFLSGCDKSATAQQSPQGGYATGRITFEDGRAITGDVQDYEVIINGVSEAGERVSYTPTVKNGAYSQKLVPGEYKFSTCTIKVKLGEAVYALDLVPVGLDWNKSRSGAGGIVQDFVWKPTGPRLTKDGLHDLNNDTHWHGLSLGMLFQIYRADIGQITPQLPEGAKLSFILNPTSKSIDGLDLKPILVERAWRPKDNVYRNDDLNDLPLASYEISGTATLPDGTTKPILLRNIGKDQAHTQKAIVAPIPYSSGGIWKLPFGWVTE